VTQEKTFSEVRVVYTGRVELKGGKLGHSLLLLSDFDASQDAFAMIHKGSPFSFKPGKQPRTVGGIYRVLGHIEDGDLATIRGDVTWDGERVPNAAAFEAYHKAAEVAHRARKAEEAEAKNGALAKALAGIRKSYVSTDSIGRLALEVVILAELRKR